MMRFIALILLEFLFESLLFVVVVGKDSYSGSGPIVGATPCCLDRLTSIVCRRIKEKNNAAFLHQCLSNPDFAFVQCCRTCFPMETDDPFRLDYKKTVHNLLMSPHSEHTCYNRRSNEWCNDFVMRRSIFAEPNYRRFNCANMPVAFRECRHACGYCRLSEDEKEVANYDYQLATDPISCHNPSYGLAFHKVDFKKVFQKFEERFARYLRARRMRHVMSRTDSIEE